MTTKLLTDPEAIEQFIFAGNATFTLVSKKTLKRFTYRVRRADARSNFSAEDIAFRPWFISLLTGPDNDGSFTYLGAVFPVKQHPGKWTYAHSHKSPLTINEPSAYALEWFCWSLATRSPKLSEIEVWHEGRCGRCGRKLTVPESIATGFGPECADRAFWNNPAQLDLNL